MVRYIVISSTGLLAGSLAWLALCYIFIRTVNVFKDIVQYGLGSAARKFIRDESYSSHCSYGDFAA